MLSTLAFVTPIADDTEEGMLAEIGSVPEMALTTLTGGEESRLSAYLDGARVTPDPVLKMAYLRGARQFCREAAKRFEEQEDEVRGQVARERASRFFAILIPLLAFLIIVTVVSRVWMGGR